MATVTTTQLFHCGSEANEYDLVLVKLYLQQYTSSLRTVLVCETCRRPSVVSKVKSLSLEYVLRCCRVRRIGEFLDSYSQDDLSFPCVQNACVCVYFVYHK